MLRNRDFGLHCSVYAFTRDSQQAAKRFTFWGTTPYLHFVEGDVNQSSNYPAPFKFDYVLHLASNTHPVAYATDPIGTITANIIGTRNMLDFASKCSAQRFVFASSNEIYGENRGDQELFNESYLGYIDCNTLRAGYPESKRCGEAMCQAYRSQEGLDTVIARLTRSFGPSLKLSDSKASTQFLKNGLNQEDIVLKSAGTQYYSYTYTVDAVTGLLTILLKGKNGDAYNIADTSCDIQLKDFAQIVAKKSGTSVIFDLPSSVEAAGFSKATKARLDGSKLSSMGWRPYFSIEEAIQRTLIVLKESINS